MSKIPQLGEICWTELATPDVDAAKQFYGKCFGWQFTEHDMGDGKLYTMVKAGEKEFGGFWEIPKEQVDLIPPYWISYILVENVEESLQKAQDLGASVKMPVTKIGNFGLFAILVEPTGAHIALWESLNSGSC